MNHYAKFLDIKNPARHVHLFFLLLSRLKSFLALQIWNVSDQFRTRGTLLRKWARVTLASGFLRTSPNRMHNPSLLTAAFSSICQNGIVPSHRLFWTWVPSIGKFFMSPYFNSTSISLSIWSGFLSFFVLFLNLWALEPTNLLILFISKYQIKWFKCPKRLSRDRFIPLKEFLAVSLPISFPLFVFK